MPVRRDVLEEFAEPQSMGPRHVYAAGLHQPLASIQRAYRVRRRMLGLCRSCSREAAPDRASCPEHLEKNNARARASQERHERA